MRLLLSIALPIVLGSVGCGGIVSHECPAGQTKGKIEIAVSATYAADEVVVIGDCSNLTCKEPTGSGCTLWAGDIATIRGAACRIALVQNGTRIDLEQVEGNEACGTTAKRVTIGEPPLL